MIFYRKLSRLGILALFAGAVFFAFARPGQAQAAIGAGWGLCTGPLLCGLFPFMVLSRLLLVCDTHLWAGRPFCLAARLAGVKNKYAGSPILLAWTGGFAPACTALDALCRAGRLSAAECTALLPLCLWAGPSFAVLTLGDALGSRWAGWCLYAGQLAAGLVCAVLGRVLLPRGGQQKAAAVPLPAGAAPTGFSGAIGQAALSYVQLCGCVIFFRFLAEGVTCLPQPLDHLACFLEISSGGLQAAAGGIYGCCAVISLLGVSVLVQARALLPQAVSLAPFLLLRPVHWGCAALVVRLLLPLGPAEAAPVYASLAPAVLLRRRWQPGPLLLLFLLLCRAAVLLCTAPHWKKRPPVL